MGADSVSSTLSSLSKPPTGQDDFDVFAQTRTGVLSAPAQNRWEQEFTCESDPRLPTSHPLTLRHLPALHLSSSAESRGVPAGPPPTLDIVQPAAVAVSANQSDLRWQTLHTGLGLFAKSRPHETDNQSE